MNKALETKQNETKRRLGELIDKYGVIEAFDLIRANKFPEEDAEAMILGWLREMTAEQAPRPDYVLRQ